MNPIDKVLSKFPDAKECNGGWRTLCPVHGDRDPSLSIAVSNSGIVLVKCFAGCELKSILEAVGLEIKDLFPASLRQRGDAAIDLTGYAELKQLPIEFLKELGLATSHYAKRPCVKIPYYDKDKNETTVRFRLSVRGDKFRWRKGSKAQLYGLWRLSRADKYIVLVEGESDAQTLWLHDIPALGVPGAGVWQDRWSEHVEHYDDVFLWREPDGGGSQFVTRVGKSLPHIKILTPDKYKDISEYHLRGEDVPAVVLRLMADAHEWSEVEAQQYAEQAKEAKGIATELMRCPDILAEFGRLCGRLGLVGERKRAALLYLILTSRVLPRIVSGLCKGTSAVGKNIVVNTVLRAFPESAFYVLSSLSERALIYDEEPLSHRILIIYEAEGVAGSFGAYLLRTLLSEGHIRYVTVEKTSEGLRSRLIEREGPTGAIITTTRAGLHPENETRTLSFDLLDTPAQTQFIMNSQADEAVENTGPPDLAPWKALQTWLSLAGIHEVTIPFAPTLAALSAPVAVRLRRDFPAVLSLIKAHAILHQATRERDGKRIIASLVDYRAVYALVNDIVSEGVQATVKMATRETVAAVAELTASPTVITVTTKRVGDRLGLDRTAAWRRCVVALRDGYLDNLEERKGRPYKLVMGNPMPEDVAVLPEPDELEGEWLRGCSDSAGDNTPPLTTGLLPSSLLNSTTYLGPDKETRGDEGGGVIPPETTATAQPVSTR